MGAILLKMAVFFFENAFCVGLFQSFYDGGDLDENGCFSLSKTRFALDFFTHFSMGAILMKMAFFLTENAFCVGLFQSFYDGGDLDENGCFP